MKFANHPKNSVASKLYAWTEKEKRKQKHRAHRSKKKKRRSRGRARKTTGCPLK